MDVLDAERNELSEIEFATRPTQRFHGSIPALIEAINVLMRQEVRILLAAANQGEVERLPPACCRSTRFPTASVRVPSSKAPLRCTRSRVISQATFARRSL